MDSTTWEVALEFELWASQLQDSDSWGNSTIPHLPQFLHPSIISRSSKRVFRFQLPAVLKWGNRTILPQPLQMGFYSFSSVGRRFDNIRAFDSNLWYLWASLYFCLWSKFLLTLWAMNDQLGWGIVKILIFLKGMMKIKAEACTRRKRKELQSTVLESAIHFFWLQSWVRRSRHRELPMYISLPIPSFLP